MLLLVREWRPPPPSGEQVPVFYLPAAARGLTITILILAWMCSLLRLYVRLAILGAAWWDDLFIALTMMATTVGSIVYCILPNVGMGRHLDSMTTDEMNTFTKVFYVGSVSYPLSLSFIKIALLFQYLRIFEVGSRRRLLCKWLIGFTSVWGIFYGIPGWFPCWPVSDMWNLESAFNGTRRCWGYASPDISQALGFYISQSLTTTLLDLIIFLLPIHLYFKPDTQRKTRINLLCLFGLGLAVNFCSVCRLVYSLKPTLDAMWDLSWNSPAPTGLAVIEICLASICAALPVFWPVLKIGWGKILVTYEVTITREYGVFVPRRKKKIEPPRTSASDRELTAVDLYQSSSEQQQQPEWDPYVGDAKTGLGESETIVESPAKRPVKKAKEKTSFVV